MTRVKMIRTNNGPEFIMLQYYATKGIVHQTSCAESPQQNGRVERKHQHVLNVGRALLFQSKLPKQFWSYAILHATFIINRVPSPILKNQSPFHLLHKQIPNLHELKVFGSLCYASTLQSHRTKLMNRARKCIFLGYKYGVKGAVLLDLNNKEIFISRNVTHHELIFPYKPSSTSSTWQYHSTPPLEPPNITTPPLEPPNITTPTLSPQFPTSPPENSSIEHTEPAPQTSPETSTVEPAPTETTAEPEAI